MASAVDPHLVCIHCGYPTSCLYRLLPGNHIKLVECKNCHHDVDPYIEREMLLVIMDLILLRSPAYRHIIFNRPILNHVILGWFIVIFFPTFLRLASDAQSNNLLSLKGTYSGSHVLFACLSVILELTSLIIGTTISTLCFIHHYLYLQQDKRILIHIIRSISIAILFPYLFSIVTAFVHIYEPSKTIRNLGAFFITGSQLIGVDSVMTCYRQYFIFHSTVLEKVNLSSNTTTSLRILNRIPSLPFLIGLIGSIYIRSMLDHSDI